MSLIKYSVLISGVKYNGTIVMFGALQAVLTRYPYFRGVLMEESYRDPVFIFNNHQYTILSSCGGVVLYTVNPVIYAVILFMRIMRVVVRAHK